MNYKEDLEAEAIEFELNLREGIMNTREFQERFPNLTDKKQAYSDEVNLALDTFKQEYETLYDTMKDELRVYLALIFLNRRVEIEFYKRLNLSFAKDYLDNEDQITICSDEDLIYLSKVLKRLLLDKESVFSKVFQRFMR